jgi:hypothetical protein
VPIHALPKRGHANKLASVVAALDLANRWLKSELGDQKIGVDELIWLRFKQRPTPSVNAKDLVGQLLALIQTGP